MDKSNTFTTKEKKIRGKREKMKVKEKYVKKIVEKKQNNPTHIEKIKSFLLAEKMA